VCQTLYQDSADIVVLGRVSGEASVGFYSMAKQLALMPVEKIAVVIGQIASPVMAGLQADDVSLRAWLFRAIRIVAWTTFPLNVGLMLLGRDVVDLVLTAKWRSLTPTLYPLCLFAMVRSVDLLLTCVFLARYRAKELFRYQLTLLGLMPAAFWAGSAWGGAFGVAIAWAAVFPVVALFMARDALAACGASWRELGVELSAPMVATLSLAGAIVAVKWALPVGVVEAPVARVVVAGGLAVAAYGAVLLRTTGPIRGEIRQVAAWFLRRAALPEPAK
jgi:O-antigen/teichoic acid export membrane protein